MPPRANAGRAGACAIALPPGARVAVHSCAQRSGGWLVMVAPPGVDPAPDALGAAGAVSALVTHARGVSQPDATGLRLAEATLAAGGTVGFHFRGLADAIALADALRRGAA
jgi:hypothetical protein